MTLFKMNLNSFARISIGSSVVPTYPAFCNAVRWCMRAKCTNPTICNQCNRSHINGFCHIRLMLIMLLKCRGKRAMCSIFATDSFRLHFAAPGYTLHSVFNGNVQPFALIQTFVTNVTICNRIVTSVSWGYILIWGCNHYVYIFFYYIPLYMIYIYISLIK